MLFGCCTNILPRNGGSVGAEYLPVLSELGYDYVELPLGDIIDLSVSEKMDLMKLSKNTIPIYSCNNFFKNEIRLCGKNTDPYKIREYIKLALQTAADLGVKIGVFGSPWSKRCPEDFPKSEAFKQLASVCAFMGEEAEKYGINIALEPNNKLETNMINTYSDVLELIKAVNHPRVQGLQDYYHLKQEGVTVDSMIEGAAHLIHTHFARFDGRKYPKSIEEDDYYGVYFKTLKDINYCGGISIEAFVEKKEDFRQEAFGTLNFFRQMIDEC